MHPLRSKMIIHQELLEACRKGDRKAQMQIYELYYKAMYNISLHIVKDTMEAEDIMQEAFLTAFEHLKKTELEISFGGWLKRIVVNRSLDAVKKRKVQFEQVDELPISQEETSWEEQETPKAEAVQRIKRAMLALPEKYRSVLSLNLLEGYDHEEIGQILGIPPSTSRAHLSRGKQKLIQMMAAV